MIKAKKIEKAIVKHLKREYYTKESPAYCYVDSITKYYDEGEVFSIVIEGSFGRFYEEEDKQDLNADVTFSAEVSPRDNIDFIVGYIVGKYLE